MKKLVVFTGAGVSAESGLATFRDSDGTWGNYKIEEVCIPEALDFNRRGVIRFYNDRRREMLAAEPNPAHLAIAALERDFDVQVITQNVDNLHERAGSTHILHLHGELTKLRSSDDPSLVVPFGGIEQGFDDTAGAVRASRNSGLCGRSGPPGDPGHPQSAGGDPQMCRRGRSGVGRSPARNLCGTSRARVRHFSLPHMKIPPLGTERRDFRPMAGRRTIPASRPCP